MTNPLELHVSGLREGEIPTFRIQPVGPNPEEPVFLSLESLMPRSNLLDGASKHSSPDWHLVRQGLLASFYRQDRDRG